MAGMLALVVGPSGAGKDTLISAARQRLAGDLRFVFVRRVITREAVVALEDHDSLSRETFEARRRAGGFALSWEAHGLGYGLPRSIDADLASGHVVVANVSRQVVAEALSRYPGCVVVLIGADAAVRAQRLAGRGRESGGEITARLSRETDALPASAPIVRIDNSGALEDGIAAFVAALQQLAAQ